LHGISEMIMMNKRSYCRHCTYLVWDESDLDVKWSNNYSTQQKLFI